VIALLKELDHDRLLGAIKHPASNGAEPQVNNLRYIINTTFPKLSFDSIRS